MATSPLVGRVRFDTTLYDAANVPLSNAIVRDRIANNLLHHADEGGAQVRVAFSGLAPGLGGGQGYYTIATPPSADTWYHITSSGTWAMPIRAGGHSYRLRVRVGGATSSGGTDVKFALVLGPPDVVLARALLDSTEDNVFETVTTSSASAAWLTGASQGDLASELAVRLDEGQVERFRARTSALAAIGGAPVVVDQCLVALHVFGSTANVSASPRLYGLYAADFVGA